MDICLIGQAGHGAGHDGDIIDAAGIERRLNEGLSREGGIVSMRKGDLQNAFVRQHVGESVGTEQQHIADADIDGKEIALDDRSKPDRPSQDVTVRMPGRLLRSEAALAHRVVNQGVVASQLRGVPRPDEIGPAVADIEHEESRGGQSH